MNRGHRAAQWVNSVFVLLPEFKNLIRTRPGCYFRPSPDKNVCCWCLLFITLPRRYSNCKLHALPAIVSIESVRQFRAKCKCLERGRQLRSIQEIPCPYSHMPHAHVRSESPVSQALLFAVPTAAAPCAWTHRKSSDAWPNQTKSLKWRKNTQRQAKMKKQKQNKTNKRTKWKSA